MNATPRCLTKRDVFMT